MTKILRVTLIIIFAILVLLFISADIYVRMYAPQAIVNNLKQAFKRDVTLGSVKYQFPASIRVKELRIDGAFGVKTAVLSLGMPAWGARQIVFSEIFLKEPDFILERTPDLKLNWGVFAQSKYRGGVAGPANPIANQAGVPGVESAAPAVVPQQEDDSLYVDVSKTFNTMLKTGAYVKHVRIIDGRVSFIDGSYEPKLEIRLADVSLSLHPITYPLTPVKTEVKCAGVVENSNTFFNQSWFEIDGWINMALKDSDLKAKVIDPDGTVNLLADLVSRNNAMLVKGRVNLGSSGKKEENAAGGSSASDNIWDALKAANIAMNVNFSFQSKLDNFHVGRVAIEGDIGVEGLGKLDGLMK